MEGRRGYAIGFQQVWERNVPPPASDTTMAYSRYRCQPPLKGSDVPSALGKDFLRERVRSIELTSPRVSCVGAVNDLNTDFYGANVAVPMRTVQFAHALNHSVQSPLAYCCVGTRDPETVPNGSPRSSIRGVRVCEYGGITRRRKYGGITTARTAGEAPFPGGDRFFEASLPAAPGGMSLTHAKRKAVGEAGLSDEGACASAGNLKHASSRARTRLERQS